MHILAAFVIFLAFANGFHPISEEKESHAVFVVDPDQRIVLRTPVVTDEIIQFRHLVRQNFDYSCGSAALATLLNAAMGENLTERQVIHGLMEYGDKEQIAARRAFSLLDMKRFVNVLGYDSAGYKAKMENLLDPQYWPAIVPIKIFDYRHFVVFRGAYGGHVFIADPWRGNSSYTEEQFASMWYDNVMFLVSNGEKKHPNLLRLRTEDLRYIDEDTARYFVFDQEKPFNTPRDTQVPVKDGVPAGGYFYKP